MCNNNNYGHFQQRSNLLYDVTRYPISNPWGMLSYNYNQFDMDLRHRVYQFQTPQNSYSQFRGHYASRMQFQRYSSPNRPWLPSYHRNQTTHTAHRIPNTLSRNSVRPPNNNKSHSVSLVSQDDQNNHINKTSKPETGTNKEISTKDNKIIENNISLQKDKTVNEKSSKDNEDLVTENFKNNLTSNLPIVALSSQGNKEDKVKLNLNKSKNDNSQVTESISDDKDCLVIDMEIDNDETEFTPTKVIKEFEDVAPIKTRAKTSEINPNGNNPVVRNTQSKIEPVGNQGKTDFISNTSFVSENLANIFGTNIREDSSLSLNSPSNNFTNCEQELLEILSNSNIQAANDDVDQNPGKNTKSLTRKEKKFKRKDINEIIDNKRLKFEDRFKIDEQITGLDAQVGQKRRKSKKTLDSSDDDNSTAKKTKTDKQEEINKSKNNNHSSDYVIQDKLVTRAKFLNNKRRRPPSISLYLQTTSKPLSTWCRLFGSDSEEEGKSVELNLIKNCSEEKSGGIKNLKEENELVASNFNASESRPKILNTLKTKASSLHDRKKLEERRESSSSTDSRKSHKFQQIKSSSNESKMNQNIDRASSADTKKLKLLQRDCPTSDDDRKKKPVNEKLSKVIVKQPDSDIKQKNKITSKKHSGEIATDRININGSKTARKSTTKDKTSKRHASSTTDQTIKTCNSKSENATTKRDRSSSSSSSSSTDTNEKCNSRSEDINNVKLRARRKRTFSKDNISKKNQISSKDQAVKACNAKAEKIKVTKLVARRKSAKDFTPERDRSSSSTDTNEKCSSKFAISARKKDKINDTPLINQANEKLETAATRRKSTFLRDSSKTEKRDHSSSTDSKNKCSSKPEVSKKVLVKRKIATLEDNENEGCSLSDSNKVKSKANKVKPLARRKSATAKDSSKKDCSSSPDQKNGKFASKSSGNIVAKVVTKSKSIFSNDRSLTDQANEKSEKNTVAKLANRRKSTSSLFDSNSRVQCQSELNEGKFENDNTKKTTTNKDKNKKLTDIRHQEYKKCKLDNDLNRKICNRRKSAPIMENFSSPILSARETEIRITFESCTLFTPKFPILEKCFSIKKVDDNECVDLVYICEPTELRNDSEVISITNQENLLVKDKNEESITLYRSEDNISSNEDVQAVSATIPSLNSGSEFDSKVVTSKKNIENSKETTNKIFTTTRDVLDVLVSEIFNIKEPVAISNELDTSSKLKNELNILTNSPITSKSINLNDEQDTSASTFSSMQTANNDSSRTSQKPSLPNLTNNISPRTISTSQNPSTPPTLSKNNIGSTSSNLNKSTKAWIPSSKSTSTNTSQLSSLNVQNVLQRTGPTTFTVQYNMLPNINQSSMLNNASQLSNINQPSQSASNARLNTYNSTLSNINQQDLRSSATLRSISQPSQSASNSRSNTSNLSLSNINQPTIVSNQQEVRSFATLPSGNQPSQSETNSRSNTSNLRMSNMIESTILSNKQDLRSSATLPNMKQISCNARSLPNTSNVPTLLNNQSSVLNSHDTRITNTFPTFPNIRNNQEPAMLSNVNPKILNSNPNVSNLPVLPNNINPPALQNTSVASVPRLPNHINPSTSSNLQNVDFVVIVDVLAKHIYVAAHIFSAHKDYINWMNKKMWCKNYFKAQIIRMNQLESERLANQSTELFNKLNMLNLRNFNNLPQTAYLIVEHVTVNLRNKDMPTPVTKSLVYILMREVLKPRLELFKTIPLISVLINHIGYVVDRIQLRFGPFTEEMLKLLRRQIEIYNRLLRWPYDNPHLRQIQGMVRTLPNDNANQNSFARPILPISKQRLQQNVQMNQLPGGANTNSLGRTPRYLPNENTPINNHVYAPSLRNAAEKLSTSSMCSNVDNNILLKELLAGSENPLLFAKPTNPKNRNFPIVKLPYTQPITPSTNTATVQESSSLFSKSIGPNNGNFPIVKLQYTKPITSSTNTINTSTSNVPAPVTVVISQKTITSSRGTATSTSTTDVPAPRVVETSEKSKTVLNQGFSALSSIGPSAEMLQTSVRLSKSPQTQSPGVRSQQPSPGRNFTTSETVASCFSVTSNQPSSSAAFQEIVMALKENPKVKNEIPSVDSQRINNTQCSETIVIDDEFEDEDNKITANQNGEYVLVKSEFSVGISQSSESERNIKTDPRKKIDSQKVEIIEIDDETEDTEDTQDQNGKDISVKPELVDYSQSFKSKENKKNSSTKGNNSQLIESIEIDVEPKEAGIDSQIEENVLVKSELPQILNENEIEIIDLTWIDEIDETELKKEIDLIKQEPIGGEEENEEEKITYTVVRSHCICGVVARYACNCGDAFYCSQQCQLHDWIASHQKACLKKMTENVNNNTENT